MATQNDPPTNIVLTGFMGVGKTTIGKRVADFVQRYFVDTDDLIIARAGMTIPQIFAKYGESYFRVLEREVGRDLAAKERFVIATGGGMLVDETTRAVLSASGYLVCLDATPEVIEERLKHASDRPLAANWRDLYDQRRTVYAAIPVHVSVVGKTADQLAQEIILLWRTAST